MTPNWTGRTPRRSSSSTPFQDDSRIDWDKWAGRAILIALGFALGVLLTAGVQAP